MMTANMEPKTAKPKTAGLRGQAMLMVKVLLVAAGTLGLLALLDWVATS